MSILPMFFGRNTEGLDFAYYVGDDTQKSVIMKCGIPLCPDGQVHLFGNLTCAFQKRELLEANGLKAVIFKIDTSMCGKCQIDSTEEELAKTAPCEQSEMCHGFVFSKPIPPEAILEVVELL